ncbi:hypothetical protein [Parasitella parasitica]|uniref:CCHC-type domain-containing protein n=1 Tax=Parasitella parasitica TaxID=35722 RepID=A0A0B7NWB3_9FUNG|nr:hypothetical protein [Parasitella parasitica]
MAYQADSTKSSNPSAEGDKGASRRSSSSNSHRQTTVSSKQATLNSGPSGSGGPNIHSSVAGTTMSRYPKTSHTSVPAVMNYAVEHSVLHFSPMERQNITLMLSHYAAKIEEMKERINGFHGSIEITRTTIRDTLVSALHKVPTESLLEVVQKCQWPNENVCKDLDLSLEYALMYRGTYRLPKKTVVLPEGTIDQTAEDAAARIKELEAIINKLSIRSKVEVNPTKKEGGNPTTVLSDAKPIEKKVDYIERRKRTKLPRFSQGAASEAKQWIKHYKHLLLSDNALNWYLNINKTGWLEVKKAFLLQVEGFDDPALVALAELKKLCQGRMSMKQFVPLIADLLDRAQIYRPGIQIDYFKERIKSELLRSVIYRGLPKTLIEAINITTEVEEDLKRLGQNATTPAIPSINYGASSSGSNASTATEQQNFQRTGNFKSKHKHGGGSGYSYSSRNGSGHGSNGGSAKFGPKKHETRTCYRCGKRSHISRDCSERKSQERNNSSQQLVEAPEDKDTDKMVYIFAHHLGMDWMVHEDWALRPKTRELFKIPEVQNTQTLKTKEEQRAKDVLKDHPSLTPNDEEPQTVKNEPYKHRIITGDALPVHVRDYRRPYAETQQIKIEV